MARVSNLKGTGPGRPKGCRNKVTFELQKMIERALVGWKPAAQYWLSLRDRRRFAAVPFE